VEIDLRHPLELVRLDLDQPFGRQSAERLAHRRGADAQMHGQRDLTQQHARRQCAGNDRLPQPIDHRLP
jgi:hypothetical protein